MAGVGAAEDLTAPTTGMALVKSLVDRAYEPTYTDPDMLGVHCCHNLVFIEKGRDQEGNLKRIGVADSLSRLSGDRVHLSWVG